MPAHLQEAVPGIPVRSGPAAVPVLRPRLPTAERLLPYLQRIDASRTYTNFGPLLLEFEQRVAAVLGVREGAFASASTGTAALEAAILALAGRATASRPLALLPAYTFVATAIAVQACGYQPYLLDLADDSWVVDPARLRTHPMVGRAGLVVPVAPYGAVPDQAGWAGFMHATGVPVVIDAAASFESIAASSGACLGPVPVMLSFHATKSFATGEGGGVACDDPVLAARVTQCANFGFLDARDSRAPSINGKMSEYHAAIGLAELDGWVDKLAQFARVHAAYARRAASAGLTAKLPGPPTVASCYRLLRADDVRQARRVTVALDAAAIGHRLWYGTGIQAQSHFAAVARDSLPATEALAPCLLGLPMAPDLDEATIARVMGALEAGLADG